MLIHDVIAPAKPTRWALVLHGLGDNKEGWKDVVPMLGLDGWGFIFAQAPDVYGPGWSWFDLQLPNTKPNHTQVERARGLICALIAHLTATRGIACADLALIGFSQGCLMAVDVALHHDQVFAGVVGISGWISGIERYPAEFGSAAHSQRYLMTHGHFDNVIPISRTRPQAAQLKALGLDVGWAEYDKDHGLDPESELQDIRRFLLRS